MTTEAKKKVENIIDDLTAMVMDEEFGAHDKQLVLNAIDLLAEAEAAK